LLVNYKDGKVLVKAPIWTWKSFLFFDGPIYGLYKSSDRVVINKDSKQWEIQLLFSVNDKYFLVVRKLKLSKWGWDSAKTYLYSILKDKNFIDYLENYQKEDIILQNNDILTLLNFYQIKTEDLTTNFKQERELQDNLNELLPPKDVALTTIFLPQNSENIFELNPSARINILKQVFGILGIDDAKKIIDEKRRELAWMLKAKQENSSFKEKFNDIYEKINKIRKNIKDYSFWQLDEFINNFQELDEDLFDVNLDKMKTLDIDFDSILKTHKEKQEKLLTNQQEYKNILQQIQQKEDEKKQLATKIKEIENEINLTKELEKKQEWLKLEIKAQKLKIGKIQEKEKDLLWKYDDLQKQYQNYLILKNNQQNLEKEKKEQFLELEKIENLIKNLENKKSKIEQIDNSKYEKRLDELKKEIEKFQNIDFDFYSFDGENAKSISELLSLFSKIETEGKSLSAQIKKDENHLKTLIQELEQLKKQEEQNKKKIDFNCEKINADCPFIEKISTKLLWKNDFFEKQIQQKTEQKKLLEKEIEKLNQEKNKLVKYWKDKKITSFRKEIELFQEKEKEYKQLMDIIHKNQEQSKQIAQINWQIQEASKQKENLQEKLKNLQKKLETTQQEIKAQKNIEADYKEFEKIKKELEAEQQKLMKFSEELDKLEEKETIIKTLIWEKNQIEKQLTKIEKDLQKLEKNKSELTEKLQNKDLKNLKEIEKNILDLKELVGALNTLIKDYQKNKLSIIELKQKLDLYKNLSNIFGKELVIYVFSDYLENLQALINYFIQDIVNFKLYITLDEKWENLDIFVEDEKWKRDVKSLSWWQKTALRIGWILWISRLQHSKVLFLDETINNFDQESVQLIAQKIKEFIEENDMKFYMITHSDVLQNSDIWTDMVELNLKTSSS